MTHAISIRLTAPFDIGDVVARVRFDDGSEEAVVLRGGTIERRFEKCPLRFVLSDEPAPQGEEELSKGGGSESEPEGTLVTVHELFDHGVAVPVDGRVVLKVAWGAPCHLAPPPHVPEGKRFGSWEHILTAELVGKGPNNAPLIVGGRRAPFDATKPLPVGDKMLRFGEIIALAGDFFAHYDEQAASELAWAWPATTGFARFVGGDYRATTLASESASSCKKILAIVFRDRDADRGAAGEFAQLALDAGMGNFPARRYLALAAHNFCHFGSQPASGAIDDGQNDALRVYRAYHARALALATTAASAVDRELSLLEALGVDAFACHFLTDLFAAGHMRVPRRVLGERYGILCGALHRSHAMHAEDNKLGLWCTSRVPSPGGRRIVWRAYGDGMLRTGQAEPHLARVREAVRRSAAEVFHAFCGMPASEAAAETLLPVVLPPGAGPQAGDDLPGGNESLRRDTNHYPRYAVWPDGRVGQRYGSPNEGLYRFDGDVELVSFAEEA
jgi:hypothetical protein